MHATMNMIGHIMLKRTGPSDDEITLMCFNAVLMLKLHACF